MNGRVFPTGVVHAAPLILEWIRANIQAPVLIGPNAESAQWVSGVAKGADARISLAAAWLILQARLEEIDLLQRLPAYRKYIQEVPRFVPRFWRRRR